MFAAPCRERVARLSPMPLCGHGKLLGRPSCTEGDAFRIRGSPDNLSARCHGDASYERELASRWELSLRGWRMTAGQQAMPFRVQVARHVVFLVSCVRMCAYAMRNVLILAQGRFMGGVLGRPRVAIDVAVFGLRSFGVCACGAGSCCNRCEGHGHPPSALSDLGLLLFVCRSRDRLLCLPSRMIGLSECGRGPLGLRPRL